MPHPKFQSTGFLAFSFMMLLLNCNNPSQAANCCYMPDNMPTYAWAKYWCCDSGFYKDQYGNWICGGNTTKEGQLNGRDYIGCCNGQPGSGGPCPDPGPDTVSAPSPKKK